ncbi:NPL6 [Candida margitis]|uniref:NPL6 n=1 Tax=Candida margitis TaxID=1775924 RepID=UPI002227B241|nr:NPL6 [Candida margitis]KAI5953889.1 NPL6 [Candida margitis]
MVKRRRVKKEADEEHDSQEAYHEEDTNIEDDEVVSVDDVEDEDNEISRRKKKRKTNASNVVKDEDDSDVDVNNDAAAQDEDEDAPVDDEDDEEDGEGEEDEDEEEGTAAIETGEEGTTAEGGKRKRGRKKKEKKYYYNEEEVFDADGNPRSTENDEVYIPNEDPKGKEKIDELGYLKGGRELRMKTFKILGEGDRLYVISTIPARMVGFRDSYLLFKTHRTLFKRVCDDNQKMDLINRGIIPNSYKGRAVNLVSARSIFREFGAKMIKEGKKVIDDFWEQRAIDNGDIPGEYADPDELYKNKLSNVLGEGIGGGSGSGGIASGGNATPMAPATLVDHQTDHTWIHQIASQTSEYNHKLAELRSQVVANGYRDVFTNIVQFPKSTQSQRYKIDKIDSSDNTEKDNDTLTYDVYYKSRDLRRPITGLASVPKEIIDEIDDQEIKQAILDQQKYEIASVL